MKRIIETSEVLGVVDVAEGSCELCASAEAGLEEATGELVVTLEAFLRPVDLLVKERHFRADWLPANAVIHEHASTEESREMAREIFQRWVRKVRDSAPQLHHV